MRAAALLVTLLLLIPGVHAKRAGVEVVYAGWGEEAGGSAHPGDLNVPLLVKIKNIDSEDLGVMKLTLRYSRPLYFEYHEPGATVRTLKQSRILGGLKANATATIRYSLSVSEDARPGVYLAWLEVSYLGDPINRARIPVFLTVSGRSNLVVENITLSPQNPTPGDILKIKIDIINTGDTEIRDITCEIGLEHPFVPYSTSYTRYLKRLESGSSAEFELALRIAGDARPGNYIIPLIIKYRSESGKAVKNISIGVGISTPASFELAGIDVSPSSGYVDGAPVVPCCRDLKLEFDVVNTANVEAASVEVEIPPDNSYDVHPTKTYIGTLNPDDFSTVRVKVKVKKGSDRVDIPVIISYTDENGKRRSITERIMLNEADLPGADGNGESKGLLRRIISWLLGI